MLELVLLGGFAAYNMATTHSDDHTSQQGDRKIDCYDIWDKITHGPGTGSIQNGQCGGEPAEGRLLRPARHDRRPGQGDGRGLDRWRRRSGAERRRAPAAGVDGGLGHQAHRLRQVPRRAEHRVHHGARAGAGGPEGPAEEQPAQRGDAVDDRHRPGDPRLQRQGPGQRRRLQHLLQGEQRQRPEDADVLRAQGAAGERQRRRRQEEAGRRQWRWRWRWQRKRARQGPGGGSGRREHARAGRCPVVHAQPPNTPGGSFDPSKVPGGNFDPSKVPGFDPSQGPGRELRPVEDPRRRQLHAAELQRRHPLVGLLRLRTCRGSGLGLGRHAATSPSPAAASGPAARAASATRRRGLRPGRRWLRPRRLDRCLPGGAAGRGPRPGPAGARWARAARRRGAAAPPGWVAWAAWATAARRARAAATRNARRSTCSATTRTTSSGATS